MAYFNKDKGFGGKKFGGGGGGFGGKGFGRPRSEDRQMFEAVCAECGNACQVPFRPASGKPVFCNNCFKRDGDGPRFENRDSGRGGFGKSGFGGGQRGFGKQGFGDRQMFEAVCAECGERCEVPFRPSGEKPVYCKECFGGGKDEPRGARSSSAPSSDQLNQLNVKLDKIIKELEMLRGKKSFVVGKEEGNEKEAKHEEPKAKDEPKSEAKKPVAKKAAKAKAKGKAKSK